LRRNQSRARAQSWAVSCFYPTDPRLDPPKFHMPYAAPLHYHKGVHRTLIIIFVFLSRSHGSLTYALVTRTDIRHPQKSRIYPVHPHYCYSKRHRSPSLHPAFTANYIFHLLIHHGRCRGSRQTPGTSSSRTN
jgi:hypothetical protein